jgi:hypothetical protein
MKIFNKGKETKLNYLELTPVRNYDHVLEESGLVSVLVPRFPHKILGQIVNPFIKSQYFKARLDEFGSETWLVIDSSRNVLEIAGHLENKFGVKVQPVTERITKFLSDLYKYNFITFKELNKN